MTAPILWLLFELLTTPGAPTSAVIVDAYRTEAECLTARGPAMQTLVRATGRITVKRLCVEWGVRV